MANECGGCEERSTIFSITGKTIKEVHKISRSENSEACEMRHKEGDGEPTFVRTTGGSEEERVLLVFTDGTQYEL